MKNNSTSVSINKSGIKVVVPYQDGYKTKVTIIYDLDKKFYRDMNRKLRGQKPC